MKLTISQEENKALYDDLKNANKNLIINRIISAQKQNDISEFGYPVRLECEYEFIGKLLFNEAKKQGIIGENNALEDLKIHEE